MGTAIGQAIAEEPIALPAASVVPPTGAAISGKVAIFVGNEALHWGLTQFEQAGKWCKEHRVDSLVVKRADGTNRWFTDLRAEHAATNAAGAGYIPFSYCYGPKFGIIDAECDILKEYLSTLGYGCADMEMEWDGNKNAGSMFSEIMRPVPGFLFVTPLADPITTGFPVHQIAPCVNCWVPQDYDNWLWGQVLSQQVPSGMSQRIPALDLTQEFGPNNQLAIERAAVGAGAGSIWLWEYWVALSNPSLVDQIVTVMKGPA